MTEKKFPNTEGKVKEGTYQLSALFQAGPYSLQAEIYKKKERNRLVTKKKHPQHRKKSKRTKFIDCPRYSNTYKCLQAEIYRKKGEKSVNDKKETPQYWTLSAYMINQ